MGRKDISMTHHCLVEDGVGLLLELGHLLVEALSLSPLLLLLLAQTRQHQLGGAEGVVKPSALVPCCCCSSLRPDSTSWEGQKGSQGRIIH